MTISPRAKKIEDVLKALEHRSQELLMIIKSYTGFKNKALFVDFEFGEFTSIPKCVCQGASHPKRSKIKRANTNTAKYGGPSPFSSPKTHAKSAKTMLDKYGVEKPLQNQDFKDKFKNTSLQRFGTEHPFQNKVVKDNIKATMLSEYGVDNYFKTMTKYTTANGDTFVSLCKSKGVPVSWATQIACKSGVKAAIDYVNSYKPDVSDIESKFSRAIGFDKFNKKICKPLKYRPDFKLRNDLYVDVDGLYWHSDEQRSKMYHIEKRKTYNNCNLQLLQFRADEIDYKLPIVKSIVNNKLGLSIKLQARKTSIKEINSKEAKIFLTANHLMGSSNSKHLGLYLEEELVCLMSYKLKGNILKIDRFCSKIDYSVTGGFSKLLKRIEKLTPEATKVHNWVDLRYGTGEHLESKGFILAKETLGWKWTDFDKTYNRLSCRANLDERGLSEKEHAEELGWAKIHDAGQRLYIKYIKTTGIDLD